MEQPNRFQLMLMPLEIIESIAKYLPIMDLASCCATSKTMRELFGYDGIWKPRCVQGLADKLKKIPCKVVPGFTSPENEERTLEPIQTWRMNFMFENHLWNNWRLGRYKEEVLSSPTKVNQPNEKLSIYDFFLSNDCVISRFKNRVELLDVRSYPFQLATEPIILNILLNPYSNIHEAFDVKVAKNNVIIIKKSLILVFNVDFLLKKCFLQNVFFFDIPVKEPLDGSYETKLKNESTREMNFIEGEYFVGVDEKSTMHIWNYQLGLKLKEEHCPFKIIDAKSSEALILVLAVKYFKDDTVTFIAYSLSKLDYLPFKETLPSTVEYVMLKNTVAIWSNDSLSVYNCETSELLLKSGPIESTPQRIHDCFIFVHNHLLKTFNPATKILSVLPTNSVDDFEVLGNRFIQLISLNMSTECRSLWEVDQSLRTRKILMNWKFNACGFYLNDAATRYIVRYSGGHLLNFW